MNNFEIYPLVEKQLNDLELPNFNQSDLSKLKTILSRTESYNGNVDSLCIDAISVFYDETSGFPDTTYKGINKEEVRAVIQDMVLDLKKYLFEYFCSKGDPEEFINAKNNIEDAVITGIITKLLMVSGLTHWIVAIYVYGLVQYAMAHGKKSICDSFSKV